MQYKNDGIKYNNSKCLLSTVSLTSNVTELLEIHKKTFFLINLKTDVVIHVGFSMQNDK